MFFWRLIFKCRFNQYKRTETYFKLVMCLALSPRNLDCLLSYLLIRYLLRTRAYIYFVQDDKKTLKIGTHSFSIVHPNRRISKTFWPTHILEHLSKLLNQRFDTDRVDSDRVRDSEANNTSRVLRVTSFKMVRNDVFLNYSFGNYS